jgi:signal transduction histidine kinase
LASVTARGESPTTASERVAALCRLIFNFRLIALFITLVSLPLHLDRGHTLLVAFLLALAASFVPLKFWDRVSPALLRHPSFLVLDLVLAMGILAITGADNPFFYFTLSTALLSGVLYGWAGAAVFSVLLLSGYWAGVAVRASVLANQDTVQLLFITPALYPLSAAAGAAVRRVLDKFGATEEALAVAVRNTAIERERARLAREMHDSLAKSIHGISLSAAALGGWVRRDPDRAEADAQRLSEAARTAVSEARRLIGDLRTDLPEEPLADAVRAVVDRWSLAAGIPVVIDVEDVDVSSAEARWELLAVLGECLRNVERHTHAQKVHVGLCSSGDAVRLEVTDDGEGFETPADPSAFSASGHFGLLGMAERADRIGGHFEVTSAPGAGTTVRAEVPANTPASVLYELTGESPR